MPSQTDPKPGRTGHPFHSLSGRTFRSIALLSVLLGLAAIVFGYCLYRRSDSVSLLYLLLSALTLLLVAALISFLSVRHMKRTIVNPINALARAAREYTEDGRDGSRDTLHFGALDIRTGDEIENLCRAMQAMETELAGQIATLTEVTAENERIRTELALASRIQADMLPSISPTFPEREEFDLYASMKPAREVGGDFYDFFLIDDDHLGLVMADVSGKGVPAALFLIVAKILLQNFTLSGRSPAKVLEAVNRRVCANNREEMFVTVWLGVLELTTGKLTAANAGHEYPVLKTPTGRFELLRDRHGFVVGGMEDVSYQEYEVQMDPDAKLFLYTDGLPEAKNAAGTPFGADRMLAALNGAEDEGPEAILDAVSEAVSRHIGDAPQFDDLTMLCLHYHGRTSPAQSGKELTVDATAENIPVVTDFVNAELEVNACPLKTQLQLDVVIDELLANVASYAYTPEIGPVTVHISVEEEPRAVVLTFIDQGRPFNPLSTEDPDVTLSAEDREPGGLGLFLVRKTMDELSYDHQAGRNVMKIKKYF